MKIKFYTAQDLPPRKSTHSGEPMSVTYGECINDNGQVIIDKVGYKDDYELVQASKPDDIYTILKNTGVDPDSVCDLKSLQEGYAQEVVDFSQAPHTLAEALSLIKKGEIAFGSLNPDVRKEFGSAGAMVNSMFDGSFEKRVARFIPQQPVVEESEQHAFQKIRQTYYSP